MSVKQVERALAVIRASTAERKEWGPIDDRLIAQAEAELGLEFPPSYRAFVAECGACYFDDDFMHGVVGHLLPQPMVPDVVWITKDFRAKMAAPPELLFVMIEDDGPPIAIDLGTRSPDGEARVVQWFPGIEESGADPFRAVGFGSYLVAWAEEIDGMSGGLGLLTYLIEAGRTSDLRVTRDGNPASAADVDFVTSSRDDLERLVAHARGGSPSSAEQLDEIEERVRLAGPGPWHAFLQSDGGIGGTSVLRVSDEDDEPDMYLWRGDELASDADFELVAAARNEIPRLIQAAR